MIQACTDFFSFVATLSESEVRRTEGFSGGERERSFVGGGEGTGLMTREGAGAGDGDGDGAFAELLFLFLW